LDLNRQFYQNSALDDEWLQAQYSNDNGAVWLCLIALDADGQCVAFADAQLEVPNKNCVMQRNTFVRPDHRRAGLAQALKATLIRNLSDDRFQHLVTHNSSSDRAMKNMSQRFGFDDIFEYDTFSKRI